MLTNSLSVLIDGDKLFTKRQYGIQMGEGQMGGGINSRYRLNSSFWDEIPSLA